MPRLFAIGTVEGLSVLPAVSSGAWVMGDTDGDAVNKLGGGLVAAAVIVGDLVRGTVVDTIGDDDRSVLG